MIRRFTFNQSINLPLFFNFGIRKYKTFQSQKIKAINNKIKGIDCYSDTKAYDYVNKVANDLKILCESELANIDSEEKKNKFLKYNEIESNVTKSENEEKKSGLLKNIDLKNQGELKQLRKQFYMKWVETLEIQKSIRKKEAELEELMELAKKFSVQSTIYDEEIAFLTKEKIDIEKELKELYEKRNKSVRFANVPLI